MLNKLSYKSLILILLFLLIPIILFLRINQKGKDIYANWWNDSWMYRQSINISSHTSDETNVFITATIGLGSTAKAQTDAGDFRFLNSSGQQLPYYIVSGAGTTSITFHINLDSFPAGAQTLYVYYGNPSATNGFSVSDFATEASNYTLGSQGTEEVGGGPVAYWKFDEGIGTTAYDSSSNNNNGSLVNTSWKNENECISGKCIDLTNNASIRVDTNNANVLDFGTNNFTISAWALHRDYTYPKSNFMIKKSDSCYQAGAANAGFDIGHGYISNGIDICLHDTSDSYTRQTIMLDNGFRPSQLINKWVHYVIIFDRSNNKVIAYINGVKQSNELNTSSVTGSINTSSPLRIGTLYGWQTDGVYDEVKIFPYARTAAQIKADYTTGLAGMNTSSDSSVNIGGASSGKSLSDGLVGYWKFDEGVGTTTADSSGNNNLATFGSGSSAPTWAGGKFGSSLNFASNNYTETNYSSSLNPAQFSISFWAKPTTLNSSWQSVVTSRDGSPQRGYLIYLATDNRWQFWTGSGSGWNIVTTPDIAIADQWQFVTAVYDGTNAYLYLNGNLVSTSSSSWVYSQHHKTSSDWFRPNRNYS